MKRVLLTLPVALIAGSAFAMDADPVIDTDGDGVYSYPEMDAVFDDMTEDLFTQIDVNQDGAIDTTEFAAAQEAALLPMTDG